jgi:hypothetical protein
VQVLPWVFTVFTHTASIATRALSPKSNPPSPLSEPASTPDTLLFVPAQSTTKQASTWVYRILVPPQAVATLSYRIVAHMLLVSEYHFEPHRGLEVAPAEACVCYDSAGAATAKAPSLLSLATNASVIWDMLAACHDLQAAPSPRHVVYSTAMLVPLPLPDFSMPYNAIMIASALMAACLIALAHVGA